MLFSFSFLLFQPKKTAKAIIDLPHLLNAKAFPLYLLSMPAVSLVCLVSVGKWMESRIFLAVSNAIMNNFRIRTLDCTQCRLKPDRPFSYPQKLFFNSRGLVHVCVNGMWGLEMGCKGCLQPGLTNKFVRGGGI